MIRSVALSLVLLFSSIKGYASSDLKKLNNSIFKIATYGKLGSGVATAFVVNHDNKKYIVTNNHVCNAFFKSGRVILIPSGTYQSMPRGEAEFDKTDKITAYYMQMGSDICIMQSEKTSKYDSLQIGSSPAEITDDILISGFVGRSLDLMYVTGKVYGTVTASEPAELKNCLLDPSPAKDETFFTCNFFTEYPSYVNKTLQTAVNNIGPGFSGSPVLKDGKVVGIVSRYFVPASGYSNGDVIFFGVKDLQEALVGSNGHMVPVDSTTYAKWIKISYFDNNIKDYLSRMEQNLESTINDLWIESNE